MIHRDITVGVPQALAAAAVALFRRQVPARVVDVNCRPLHHALSFSSYTSGCCRLACCSHGSRRRSNPAPDERMVPALSYAEPGLQLVLFGYWRLKFVGAVRRERAELESGIALTHRFPMPS